MTRVEAVHSLIDSITNTSAYLGSLAGFADATVERDLRLAAETLDDAVTRLQLARHAHSRSLLDEIDASHRG